MYQMFCNHRLCWMDFISLVLGNGIPPYRRHIALLLMEAMWTVNIHDCIHGKLWPVPHNSSHH
ncbi:putative delta(7)-sterol 5(6)-desaturase [Helianthus annuus]|nr:putative delta(7)-sterol 5(6)-desaturase [Helianthus annuus]KAJ0590313.1 putative delta(7)-sterol 5(6)-desaturase [Helianthus annuus]KAJ0598123.1 putative delta(7)-sterol 5(6)-desaturase [Helianthus annuus]KAJ0884206.1 putative delta(7)-sterol 5(6)-desaturase [Helianthus annuus]KAJ0928240.1 putative delta(7)-sterol 5(6)-desaturase [Helianthus annuus]